MAIIKVTIPTRDGETNRYINTDYVVMVQPTKSTVNDRIRSIIELSSVGEMSVFETPEELMTMINKS